MKSFGQKFGIAAFVLLALFAACLPTFAAAPLFARFSTDRTNLYQGETFQITLAIYITGATLAPKISIDALPAPDQLQLYPFQELPNETVTLEGHPYEIRKFRAWGRAPKAGTITLSPRLDGTFILTTRSFFLTQQSSRSTQIPVEPLTLSFLPLPETGRPANFSGLVGQFAFSVVPSPLNIALGDLITVTFTIGGDLLPDTYLKPSIKPVASLKVYELKPLAGENSPTRQVFTQTVVPVNTSVTNLPACSLTFFDTLAKRYRTLTAGPFPIRYHAERAPLQTIYSPTQTTVKATITNSTGLSAHSESLPFWRQIWQRLNPRKFKTISGDHGVQVFLAPAESSAKLFTLKPGTTVTTGATNADWICISSQDGSGWIPATAITP